MNDLIYTGDGSVLPPMSTILTGIEGSTILRLPEDKTTSVYFDVDCDEGEIKLTFKDGWTARRILDLAGSGKLTFLGLGLGFTVAEGVKE